MLSIVHCFILLSLKPNCCCCNYLVYWFVSSRSVCCISIVWPLKPINNNMYGQFSYLLKSWQLHFELTFVMQMYKIAIKPK